jgi:arabinofuranosyltransferase
MLQLGRMNRTRAGQIALALLIAAYAAVLLRTAWLCDDAFITFRTIDNLLAGYGPRWNVAERVQTYTHPLWMLLCAAVAFFTHEIVRTTLALSLVVSLATVALIAWTASDALVACVAVAALSLSRAFVDYSTSGLENPLTHLLLAAFVVSALRHDGTFRSLRRLVVMAALLALNRLDTLVLIAPPLLGATLQTPPSWRSRAWTGLMGFAPLIAWELFAFVYYGSFVPNTAYAKLSTGIPAGELARQGLCYIWNLAHRDPLTFVAIVAGAARGFASGGLRRACALGIALHFIYILRIGGDFMEGRMFSAALVVAVILLADWRWWLLPIGGAVMLLGFVVGDGPLFAGADFSADRQPRNENGINDERAFYAGVTGLARVLGEGRDYPAYWTTTRAQAAPDLGSPRVETSIGMIGFLADPRVHFVDPLGLADPLLSRLPAVPDQRLALLQPEFPRTWRIGHFLRAIPDGYLGTLASGRNVLFDPEVAELADVVWQVTRGPLFDGARLRALWQLHSRGWRFDRYRFPVEVARSRLATPRAPGTAWDAPGVVFLSYNGVRIELGELSHARKIECSADNNDIYVMVLGRAGRVVARLPLPAMQVAGGGLAPRTPEVPPEVSASGFDAIELFPVYGDGRFSVGHIQLVP